MMRELGPPVSHSTYSQTLGKITLCLEKEGWLSDRSGPHMFHGLDMTGLRR